MKRYSLVILVFFLLIINILMRRAADANPFYASELALLHHTLPAGVAAAGLLAAALGAGAQVWRGALPLCGAGEWSPQRSWSAMTLCGLWCGWLPLLCALPFCSLAMGDEADTPSRWLIGAFLALLLCRILSHLPLSTFFAGRLLITLIAAAACAICGQQLWPDTPLGILSLGLAGSAALYLLTQRSPAPQAVWLVPAGLALCAYCAAFGHLLASYPPHELSPTPPEGSAGVAVGMVVLALSIICLPPLRRTLAGRRLTAALALLAAAAWVGVRSAAPFSESDSLLYLGLYAAALVLFAIPCALIYLPTRR